MSILDVIVQKKRARLEHAKAAVPLAELKGRARDMRDPRDFFGAVNRDSGQIRLIAEMKKASPSKGPLRLDFDLEGVGAIYRLHADAVSVITEEDFFMGELGYLARAKSATGLPVLRKDFIFDPYQIYEARVAGADAVLLIDSLLGGGLAAEMVDLAWELDLHVLFEVHDYDGLQRAVQAGAGIIGVNNRDLETFEIDLDTTLELKDSVPKGTPLVSESGICSAQDVSRLQEAGVDAMLIGTAFMEAEDVDSRIKELLAGRKKNKGK